MPGSISEDLPGAGEACCYCVPDAIAGRSQAARFAAGTQADFAGAAFRPAKAMSNEGDLAPLETGHDRCFIPAGHGDRGMMMMKIAHGLLVPAILAVGSATAQSTDPAGWAKIVTAIDAASPYAPASLQGQKFTVVLAGAKDEDTLEVSPVDAFKISRQAKDTFLVEIIDPARLVTGSAIKRFMPVGWRITQSGLNRFGAAIEGWGACVFKARFRPKGGNELSLDAIEDEYDVSSELSNPAQIASVERDDRGFTVSRNSGSRGPASIRLHLKAKKGAEELISNWVDVPDCTTSAPTPAPVVSVTDPDPASCMTSKVVAVAHCSEKCGSSTSTLTVRYENICKRRIKCDNVRYSSYSGASEYAYSDDHWVTVDGGSSWSFDIVVPSPNTTTFGFRRKSQSCYYI